MGYFFRALFFPSTFLRHLVCLLLIFPLGLLATPGWNIQGAGLKKEMVQNVEYRLSETYQDTALQNVADEALKYDITKALEPYGYFQPNIVIDKLTHPIKIKIDPGKQMRIRRIDVQIIGEGANNLNIKHAVHTFPLHTGQPFDSTQYEEAKNILTNAVEAQGYVHVAFKTAQVLVDLTSQTADILFVMDTGPRFYFGQLQFDPTYISPDLLKKYIPFKFGEPYSPEQILTLNKQLVSSAYFNTVNVQPKLTQKPQVPVHVKLEPVKRLRYQIGAGYGTDTGPRGRLSLYVIPVNRMGHKFNMVMQGSLVQNTVQAQYLIPGNDPLHTNYILNGGYTHLDVSAGRSSGALLGLGQQYITPTYQRTISLNALDEHYRYTNFPAATSKLLFPKLLFTWNKHEDILFSPTGYKVTVSGLAASKAILSDTNVIQASIDARAAYTAPAIHTRFFLHGIQSLTGIQTINQLPLSLAPLLGGAEDLKGYSFNSIGPGTILSYAGIEIQKETWDKLYVYGLFDAGTVYHPAPRVGYADAGVGVMWVSPVGPIKIAVAQALPQTVQSRPYQHPRLVITIGPDL